MAGPATWPASAAASTFRPGEDGEIAVVFGASRCDGEPGSALPPGRYGLRVVLTSAGGGEPSLVSPATIVTITANPAQPV